MRADLVDSATAEERAKALARAEQAELEPRTGRRD
jgi:hypothetical protein